MSRTVTYGRKHLLDLQQVLPTKLLDLTQTVCLQQRSLISKEILWGSRSPKNQRHTVGTKLGIL